LVTAKRLLDARDWEELDRVVPKITDPLSDPTDGRFLALQRHLASADTTDGMVR
jgi:hypothetical protein